MLDMDMQKMIFQKIGWILQKMKFVIGHIRIFIDSFPTTLILRQAKKMQIKSNGNDEIAVEYSIHF